MRFYDGVVDDVTRAYVGVGLVPEAGLAIGHTGNIRWAPVAAGENGPFGSIKNAGNCHGKLLPTLMLRCKKVSFLSKAAT